MVCPGKIFRSQYLSFYINCPRIIRTQRDSVRFTERRGRLGYFRPSKPWSSPLRVLYGSLPYTFTDTVVQENTLPHSLVAGYVPTFKYQTLLRHRLFWWWTLSPYLCDKGGSYFETSWDNGNEFYVGFYYSLRYSLLTDVTMFSFPYLRRGSNKWTFVYTLITL